MPFHTYLEYVVKIKKEASRKKYHILYKTTCLKTNRYYVGMHSTDKIDDGYLGSGKQLGYSIKKHGVSMHVREILEDCSDFGRSYLREREKTIVTDKMVKDPLCMNLIVGGGQDGLTEEIQARISKTLTGRKLSEAQIKANAARRGKPTWNKGLSKQTDERIAKYALTLSTVNEGKPTWNKGLSKQTDERVKKNAISLSIANTGKSMSEAGKQARRGKQAWNKGLTKQDTPNLRGNGNFWTGKTQTEEHRKKNSIANKGRKFSDETRMKMSVARRNTVERKKALKLMQENV